MTAIRSISLVAALLIVACAHTQDPSTRADLNTAPPAEMGPTGQAFYHVLMAEIALQREEFGNASKEYGEAALLSEDPAVAARATRVASGLGRDAEALSAAERWKTLEPGASEPYLHIALASLRQRDVEPALESLRVLKQQGWPAGGYDGLYQWLVGQRIEAGIAVDVYGDWIAADPDSAEAQIPYARLALRAGRYPLALEAARKATTLDPESTDAALLYAQALIDNGHSEDAVRYARTRFAEADDPQRRLEYATLIADAGEMDEARSLLLELLEAEPDMPQALLALGLIEFQEDQLDESRKYFVQLSQTGSHVFEARYFLGVISETERNYEDALRMYGQVIGGSYESQAQIRVAWVLLRLGRTDDAIAHLESFARSNPAHRVDAIIALSELYAELDQSENGLAVLESVIEENPENRQLLFQHAFLLERADRVDDAIAAMEAMLEESPDDPFALNALGYTLADRTTRYAEAREYIERALQLDPGNPAIIDSMGWVEYRLGNYNEARKHLERAYAVDRDPEIAAHLGEVYWVLGEQDRAREIWERALVRDPGHYKLEAVIERYLP
ncbi:MAG: tetratricopeptide repeat protein [Gammaproteobacteria bacterium]